MEHLLNAYYADNARKLHEVVDRILLRFGGLSDKDMDDFYSLANEVFVDVLKRYDNSQPFDVFLYSCLVNKIKTEMTRRNRYKRKIDRMCVSIDTPIEDGENSRMADIIADKFDLELEILEEREDAYSPQMLSYLERLSVIQKEMLRLTAAGYLPNEIREKLHITEKQYCDNYETIHSYRNVSVLF